MWISTNPKNKAAKSEGQQAARNSCAVPCLGPSTFQRQKINPRSRGPKAPRPLGPDTCSSGSARSSARPEGYRNTRAGTPLLGEGPIITSIIHHVSCKSASRTTPHIASPPFPFCVYACACLLCAIVLGCGFFMHMYMCRCWTIMVHHPRSRVTSDGSTPAASARLASSSNLAWAVAAGLESSSSAVSAAQRVPLPMERIDDHGDVEEDVISSASIFSSLVGDSRPRDGPASTSPGSFSPDSSFDSSAFR